MILRQIIVLFGNFKSSKNLFVVYMIQRNDHCKLKLVKLWFAIVFFCVPYFRQFCSRLFFCCFDDKQCFIVLKSLFRNDHFILRVVIGNKNIKQDKRIFTYLTLFALFFLNTFIHFFCWFVCFSFVLFFCQYAFSYSFFFFFFLQQTKIYKLSYDILYFAVSFP